MRVTGSNMEVAPGQMEIQVCNTGLAAADDSAILKYILGRVGEKYNYKLINPKPLFYRIPMIHQHYLKK